jgi:UDP-N-acetylglucosamine diphosphorylase / glucose-1-phosphate thymidylyltransferase / UDP-N-acetylgalactosamine diphosphorylase / glucosamine-1-phosphate N-acetyltransferase / galactosamine-1-phosphate N-acetyltransferase
MKALILSAGRGSRLNEFTKDKNKSMIKLFEKPLIEYNLEHAHKANVKEIIIVVGYKKEEIINHIGKEFREIKVTYVEQKQQRGLVHAIESAKTAIGNSDFLLMLGDEILVNAKIKEMLKKFRKEDLYTVCGTVNEIEKTSIGKTYSVMGDEQDRIFRLIEKPRFPINNIKGTGHCIMKNDILNYIPRTPINMNRGERELVDLIQLAIDEGKKVSIFNISNGYVNINSNEDLRLAEELMKKENPTVLIVHTQMKFLGGAELLIVELANWLTKRGIKNDILALSSSREVENLLIDTEIIIPKHNIDLKPPGFNNTKEIVDFIKIFRKILNQVKDNYDVINFHNFPVTWLLFPNKKPCVWMLNEPPNLWSRPEAGYWLKFQSKIRNWMDKKVVRRSINIICVADDFNKERCKERYKKTPRIVYYGVNHDFFSKGNANNAIKKFNLKNKFVILQAGMITEAKNQLESIKAINIVKGKIPNIFMIFAGNIADKEYKKRIDDYVKKNKLEKYILFTGNLNRNDLRDLNKAANLGIFPIGKQGGWLAPFELLCAGTPAIVSENLGAANIIKKFNLGLVNNNYSESILKIYNNQSEYKIKSREASIFIKRNLGWDVFTDKMIKAFRDAWNRKRINLNMLNI